MLYARRAFSSIWPKLELHLGAQSHKRFGSLTTIRGTGRHARGRLARARNWHGRRRGRRIGRALEIGEVVGRHGNQLPSIIASLGKHIVVEPPVRRIAEIDDPVFPSSHVLFPRSLDRLLHAVMRETAPRLNPAERLESGRSQRKEPLSSRRGCRVQPSSMAIRLCVSCTAATSVISRPNLDVCNSAYAFS